MRALLLLLSLLALHGCVTGSPQPAAFNSGATVAASAQRQIVVTVHNAPVRTAQNAGSTARAYDATGRYQVAPSALRDAAALAERYRLSEVAAWPIELLDVHCVVFEIAADQSIEDVMRALAVDPRVASVQRMGTFTTRSTQTYDDPYVGLQSSLSAMQIEAAHQWSRGRGVRIAVIDSGIDSRHPDLRGRIALARDLTGLPDRGQELDTHGLAVAGIIAASAGNGEGIVGIAPDAQLLALRACWQVNSADDQPPESRCNTFTLAQAIAVAITHRADVLNLSLAGPHDPLLERLLRRAMSMGKIVVTALPEQEGPDLAFPASLPGVLAVRTAEVAASPNSPPRALLAPGRRVLTLRPHDSYDFENGSSLAAAHVSGVVALLLAVRSNLSADDVWGLLAGKQANSTVDATTSGTIVNACSALASLLQRSECTTSPRERHARMRPSGSTDRSETNLD